MSRESAPALYGSLNTMLKHQILRPEAVKAYFTSLGRNAAVGRKGVGFGAAPSSLNRKRNLAYWV